MKLTIIFPYRESTEDRVANQKYILEHYLSLSDQHEVVEILFPDDDHKLFNRGRAIHNGVLQRTKDTDLYIFADGDLFIPQAKLLEAIALAPSVGYVVPFSSVHYLDADATRMVFRGARIEQNFRNKTYWRQPSTGGLNILTPENYRLSGGFDPRFIGWGFEDSAFDAQVQTLVGPCRWIDTPAYHLYHRNERKGASPEHLASHALCDRYRAAMKDPIAINQIINEAPRKW